MSKISETYEMDISDHFSKKYLSNYIKVNYLLLRIILFRPEIVFKLFFIFIGVFQKKNLK